MKKTTVKTHGNDKLTVTKVVLKPLSGNDLANVAGGMRAYPDTRCVTCSCP